MTDQNDLQNQVEAIIFAIGKSTELEAIAALVRTDLKATKKALEGVRKKYEDMASPLMVVEDGTKWKLTVREKYLTLVRKIVADTELSKTVMETLAVITWKNPVKQSEVIRIRTNKAYDHIKELEELGFITRTKFQRTKLIKLTEKFFQYFELEGDHSIKEVFAARRPVGQATLPMAPPEDNEAEPQVETYDKDRPKDVALEAEETEHLGKLEVFDEPEGEEQSSAPPVPNIEEPAAIEDVPEAEPEQQEDKSPEEATEPAQEVLVEPSAEEDALPVENPFDEDLEKSVLDKTNFEQQEKP